MITLKRMKTLQSTLLRDSHDCGLTQVVVTTVAVRVGLYRVATTWA
jgi:hypothetical protein